MKRLLLPLLAGYTFSLLLGSTSRADEMALRDCVIRYRDRMGLSPDMAFKECKKLSLVECIKKLKLQAPTYKSTAKEEKGYVIDLGEDKQEWQEGPFWKARGCKVNKRGDHLTRNMKDKYELTQRYRWFRQGWCPTESIQGEIYSDQFVYKKCDPSGWLVDGDFNTPDVTKAKEMMRKRDGSYLIESEK